MCMCVAIWFSFFSSLYYFIYCLRYGFPYFWLQKTNMLKLTGNNLLVDIWNDLKMEGISFSLLSLCRLWYGRARKLAEWNKRARKNGKMQCHQSNDSTVSVWFRWNENNVNCQYTRFGNPFEVNRNRSINSWGMSNVNILTGFSDLYLCLVALHSID